MAFPQLTNHEKVEFLRSAFQGGKPFVKDGVALTDGHAAEALTADEVRNLIAILMSGEPL